MKRDATASLPRRPYASLRGRAEFTRAYKSGSRRKVGGLVVVATSGGIGLPRVGVVAGRRVGNAVVRNRVKRRLREALARAELGEGATYIVVALPEVVEATSEEVCSWVRRGVQARLSETEATE